MRVQNGQGWDCRWLHLLLPTNKYAEENLLEYSKPKLKTTANYDISTTLVHTGSNMSADSPSNRRCTRTHSTVRLKNAVSTRPSPDRGPNSALGGRSRADCAQWSKFQGENDSASKCAWFWASR